MIEMLGRARRTNATASGFTTLRLTLLLPLVLALSLLGSAAQAQVDVTATAGTPAASYPTLKDAFDAINLGTHQGVIGIGLSGDTTETAPAVLNASGAGAAIYTSVLINPTGGAARTISGAIAAGSPLVDLNGADNVTINGLNTGGNSLTISNTTVSATSGTSTIRFIGGATANLITNSSILGSGTMSVATNGATIFFSTDAATANGNDNNTISNNNIGPAGANLPTKAILGNGSTSTTAIGNSGNIIDNNNIFDYFGAAVTSSGIAVNGGCNTWTITNNRFYQTGTRTWTTGAIHRAIDLNSLTATSGVQAMTVTGNIIGYASSTQTGTYSLTGSTGKFQGIEFNGITGGTVSNLNGNTIAAVSLTGVTSSGTGSTASPFSAILVNNGLANTNSNTIGSQGATGSLTFSTTTTTTSDFYGIYNFSFDDWTANSNNIGGISITNLGASGTFVVYGMRANTSTAKVFNATSNNVGGTVASSIQLTSTGASSQVVGLLSNNAISTWTSNTVRNLTNNNGAGTTTTASVIGMSLISATPNQTVTQNTIRDLSNSNATVATVVTGIQFTGGAANVVARNLIYGLTTASNSAAAEVNGIRVAGGTTVYRNNMIAVGAGITNAIGTGSTTGGVNGINEPLGTDSFFHNSVYVGGAPTAGVGPSYAFNSAQTVNTRSFRDNIFFNARSNAGATGKNYAIRVGGTTPNPAGLTSNNNILFANGTGAFTGFFNAVDQLTLANWQTATGQDLTSYSLDPKYLAPTAATPDLHIDPVATTPIEGNGFLIASVTDDFDGQTRSGLTPVDIGADAGNFSGTDLAPPVITFTALVNTTSTANRTLATTITDLTGVPTAGVGLPVIYYRKNADPYVGNACSFVSGASYDCVLNYALLAGGTVATGDVLQYYVVAQDTLGNVTSNPSAGAIGYTANPPAVATPPTTPASYRIALALTGSLTVGTGGGYPSLTNAGGLFEAINNNVLTGNVTIDILSDLAGETGANALNQWVEEGAGGYTLLLRPNGVARVVTGTSASGLIKLSGADRVTIDGSLAAGTDRSLTITNTGTGTIIWIATNATSGANNDTIKNCNLTGPGAFAGQGIIAGSGTVFGNPAEFPNSNNTIQNNAIKSVQNAAFISGEATTLDQNWLLTQNEVGSATVAEKLSFRGFLIGNAGNFTISQNVIFGINSSISTSATMSGIQVASNINGGTITRNRIANIRQNNTAGWGSNGILLGATTTVSNVTISNNFISDIASQGFANVTVADNGYGIMITTGGGYRIVSNSILLNTNQVAAGGITAAVNIAAAVTTPASIELRNNILASTQTVGTRYGVLDASTAGAAIFSTINHNDYFAQNVGFLTIAQATLAAWQTATGQDANSLAVDPLFVTVPAPADLHLQLASPMLNAGIALAGVTVDFDNDPRPAATPDIGADEVVQANLAITKTNGVGNVSPGASTTYTIVATNLGGHNALGATVTDVFPADLTCSTTCVGTLGGTCTAGPILTNINDTVNLPVGGGVTYTAVCTLSPSAVGILSNTATVAPPIGMTDPVPGNDSATDNDTTIPEANVSITKTDGSATEVPGTSVTYTIVAANAGPVAAAVTVADAFAAALTGCSTTCAASGGSTCTAGPVAGNINDVASLLVGGTATYTATCNISATAIGALINTATATVGGGVTDPATGNNTATDNDTLVPTSDVSITKTNGVTQSTPGSPVTYTIVVTNAGPSAAPTVTVLDLFPATLTSCATTCVGAGGGSCTAGPVVGNVNENANLPVGGSATYTASCTVSLSATGTLVNTATATVAGGGTDPNTANNSATDTDTLPEIFSDGFESGDTLLWSVTVPLTVEGYAVVGVASSAAAFDYDFSAVKSGEELMATAIAVVTDATGKPLFILGARRTEAYGELELTLQFPGAGRSRWVPVSEVGQWVRIEWSLADRSALGHVEVSLDGLSTLRIDGYAGTAAPAGVTLLRSPLQ